jgi:hypothetical protein
VNTARPPSRFAQEEYRGKTEGGSERAPTPAAGTETCRSSAACLAPDFRHSGLLQGGFMLWERLYAAMESPLTLNRGIKPLLQQASDAWFGKVARRKRTRSNLGSASVCLL